MQRVLLWFSLCVLMLVTLGMAITQHKAETDGMSSMVNHLASRPGVYTWVRATFSSLAFFCVSFSTPPGPACLLSDSSIPSGSALIVALLLGNILTLSAIAFPAKNDTQRQTVRDEESCHPAMNDPTMPLLSRV